MRCGMKVLQKVTEIFIDMVHAGRIFIALVPMLAPAIATTTTTTAVSALALLVATPRWSWRKRAAPLLE
jgi:hypothetical protein